MSRPLCVILSKVEKHDAMIMTYTTVINKCMITAEVSPSKYWLRVYRNGELYRQKNYEHSKDAVNCFYRYIKNLSLSMIIMRKD